jgi:hypothetical protein
MRALKTTEFHDAKAFSLSEPSSHRNSPKWSIELSQAKPMKDRSVQIFWGVIPNTQGATCTALRHE